MMTKPLTKKEWIYDQQGKLQQMVLDLCLNELSIDQALLVLEKRYGEEIVFQAACMRATAHNIIRDLAKKD